MNYIKETEETLRRYREIDWIVSKLKIEYERLSLKGKPNDISAANFETVYAGNSREDAISIMCKMGDINERIEDLLSEKQRVEETLEKIKEYDLISYNYIKERYIKGSSLEEVADEIGYSTNSKHSLYAVKNKALKQFVFFYFGKK